jgi:hypothetical protein
MSGWKPVSGWWTGCLPIPEQWHSLAHKRGIRMFCSACTFFFHVACSPVFTLCIIICFVGLRFLYAPSCGLILQLALSLLRTCSSATTGPLASHPPSLLVGGLNLSDEGVILLMTPQVQPVDLMLGRRDVPRLAYPVEWNAQLSNRLG